LKRAAPGIPFVKYQALGNDYLVVQPEDLPEPISAGWIQRLTDRHYGVGADGVLLGPLPVDTADFGLQIFNPDGSEAEKSGNGLRIFARFLWEAGLLEKFKTRPTDQETADFRIQTAGGVVTARVEQNGRWATLAMGQADFSSASIPMSGLDRAVVNETICVDGEELLFCAVSLGNPHCVVLHPRLNAEVARRLGPVIELDPRFLKRTNVQFLQVIDRQNLKIEIWERGAGYTLASGSSSCAAAAVARRLEQCDARVSVHNPGGVLQVTIAEDYHLVLAGPVKKVCRGWMADE
jgi:diaminopimelate epimerase